MDVQAVAPTISSTTFTLPAPPQPDPTPAPTPPPASSGDGGSSTAQSGLPAPAPAPTAGLALLPPAGGSSSDSGSQSLPGNVAKVYNIPASTVQVSFQAAQGSNEIVTVFTDKQSGKVIVQFPSETLIALAQFFQKLDSSANNGAVVDKKA